MHFGIPVEIGTTSAVLSGLVAEYQFFLISSESQNILLKPYLLELDPRIRSNVLLWFHLDNSQVSPSIVKDLYAEYGNLCNRLLFSIPSHCQLVSDDFPSDILLVVTLANNLLQWQTWHMSFRNWRGSIALSLNSEFMSESILQLWSTENVKLIIDTNSTSPQLARFASKLNYDVSIISSDTSNRCELKLLKPNPTYNLMIEPIQPLRDNLDSIVYSQFHKDFVKYEQYKRAIELALTDLDGTADILNILIVGPGEGGIVDKLIDILKIMSLKVKITAYEKNPKCTQILKDKNRSLWDNLVDIKIEDIRTSNLERQDLVISELLGSFGDNEACPEILSFFNIPENRPKIMIPESYTSYLQPVFTSLDPPSLQRPYLVHLTKFYPIDEPQEVWTFEHPSDSSSAQRSTNLKFRNTNIAKCISGFYGHFSATLYGHIQIQIESKSRYNFCNSWYPIFFPVSKTDLARDEVFNFEIARYSNSDQLWYEWNFKDKTYNKNGNTYVIDL